MHTLYSRVQLSHKNKHRSLYFEKNVKSELSKISTSNEGDSPHYLYYPAIDTHCTHSTMLFSFLRSTISVK